MVKSVLMSRIIFSDEVNSSGQRSGDDKSSKMTILIKRFSSGLIKTDKQVEVFKLVMIAIGIVSLISLLFSGDSNSIQQPSADLINAPQPVQPLTR